MHNSVHTVHVRCPRTLSTQSVRKPRLIKHVVAARPRNESNESSTALDTTFYQVLPRSTKFYHALPRSTTFFRRDEICQTCHCAFAEIESEMEWHEMGRDGTENGPMSSLSNALANEPEFASTLTRGPIDYLSRSRRVTLS